MKKRIKKSFSVAEFLKKVKEEELAMPELWQIEISPAFLRRLKRVCTF